MSRVSSSIPSTRHFVDNYTNDADGIERCGSYGVARASAIRPHITVFDRLFVLINLVIVSFTISLDSGLRYTFQTQAANGLNNLALLSTITTVRGVIAAVTQPTIAKLADVFGRHEIILASIFFYTGGSLLEATSTDIATFCLGAALYQVGWTCMLLLIEIIVTDITSLRARTFFLYISVVPYLITPWVGGPLAHVMVNNIGWRWAIGMFALIYPCTTVPLVWSLGRIQCKAKRAGAFRNLRAPSEHLGRWKLAKELLWQLDIVGLFLMTIMMGFILTPLTLAGGYNQRWNRAAIIVPLAIGVLAIPAFIWWEIKARKPMMPFSLFRDRAVWGALGIAISFNCAWALQSDYLYAILLVAYDDTISTATIIVNMYTFVGAAVGIIFGVVIFYVRRLKPFILVGIASWLIAFSLMIYFRGGFTWSIHKGIVAAQVLLGFGGGLFPFPSMASIQAASKHEHVALVTGIFLGFYHVGAAMGNAISGAIWTQVMPRELSNRLPGYADPEAWFNQPLLMIQYHPIGEPQRDAVVDAMMVLQRLVCSAGLLVCIQIFLFALAIRNPYLVSEQTMPHAEERFVGNDGVDFETVSRRLTRLARRESGTVSTPNSITEAGPRPL